MKQTLKDFGCELTKIPLLCDNKSAIKLANNPINFCILFSKSIFIDFIDDYCYVIVELNLVILENMCVHLIFAPHSIGSSSFRVSDVL